jgi:hypothetical protein
MTKEDMRKNLVPAISDLADVTSSMSKLVNDLRLCMIGDVALSTTEDSKKLLELLDKGTKAAKVVRTTLKARLTARIKNA